MALRLRSAAVKLLRSHYVTKGWAVRLSSTAAEFYRETSPNVVNHIFFTFVREDDLGLRIQPALGVTFGHVNDIRSELLQLHPDNASPVTGYVFVNDMLDPGQRRRGGWLYESSPVLSAELLALCQTVDRVIEQTRFFELLSSVQQYVSAVDEARWKFFTIMPTYLYGLLALGKNKKAAELATSLRSEIIKDCQERGLVLRSSDTAPYDAVIRRVNRDSAPT